MKIKKIIHYAALLIGIQTSVLFTLFLITEGISALIEGKYYVIPILSMMVFSLFGFILTFFNLFYGTRVMIVGGLMMIFYLVYDSGFDDWKLALAFGLSFLIPGLLFLFSTETKVKVPFI